MMTVTDFLCQCIIRKETIRLVVYNANCIRLLTTHQQHHIKNLDTFIPILFNRKYYTFLDIAKKNWRYALFVSMSKPQNTVWLDELCIDKITCTTVTRRWTKSNKKRNRHPASLWNEACTKIEYSEKSLSRMYAVYYNTDVIINGCRVIVTIFIVTVNRCPLFA